MAASRLWTRWCCHHDWLGWDSDSGMRPGPETEQEGQAHVMSWSPRPSLSPCPMSPAPGEKCHQRSDHASVSDTLLRSPFVVCSCHRCSFDDPVCCQDSVYDDIVMVTLSSPCHDTPGASLPLSDILRRLASVWLWRRVHRLHWNCWSLIFTQPQIKPNTMPTNNKNGNWNNGFCSDNNWQNFVICRNSCVGPRTKR